MAKVSVIVPARNERFLAQTLDDLFAKAAGEVEVVAVLDGYWPDPPIEDHRGLHLVHFGEVKGMRAAINAGAAVATGEWLMKCDAHCMFALGFDEELKRNCADNWLMIPRRYSLDPENWAIQENGKGPRDYHYLSCPIWSIRERDDYSMHGLEWPQRTRERLDKPEFEVDETLSWQGSCWFMACKHWERLGGLYEEGYGTFAQEPQEIGLKTQLGPWGGQIMVNKRTWYAHLHKGKTYGRMYNQNKEEIHRGHEFAAHFWMENRWEERAHDLEWLIDRWWPVPTWPEDWKEARALYV